MLRELTAVPTQRRPNGPGRPPRLSAHALLGVIALAGLVLIGLSALQLADIVALVSVPTAMFLCVYLSCTASAARILAGPARVAAAVAVLAVLAVLAFCGWPALLAVAIVAAVAVLATRSPRRPAVYPATAAGRTAVTSISTRNCSHTSPDSTPSMKVGSCSITSDRTAA